ncbi:MAG: TolC family protein [Planctomycetes bacterium]|nr:TolC family protein [Planctomycetota bacterium]
MRALDGPRAPSRGANAALDLAALIAMAEEGNPEIATERKEIDIATAAIWEARLYPNPTLIVEFDDYPFSSRGGSNEGVARAGVRVPIVVGDRLRAGSRAAEKEREVAALRYLWRRREVLLEVRKSYVDLLAARMSLDVARESQGVARALLETAEARLAAEAVPEAEVLKSRVEASRADAEVAAAEASLRAAERALVATVGVPGVSPERVTGALVGGFVVPSLDAVQAAVLGRSHLEQIAQAEQESARLQVAAARAERTPDLELEPTVGVNADGDGVVGLGIGIPLPLNDRNQGKIAAAEARVQQSRSRIEAARQQVTRRIVSAHRTLTMAQARASRLAAEIVPTAEKSLEQARLGHEKGKFTYLDVIDARRTLSEARAALASALAELNAAAAELEMLTGFPLVPQEPNPKPQ